MQIQKIASTFVTRIDKESNYNNNNDNDNNNKNKTNEKSFIFIPMDSDVITRSRQLISEFHISANDAVHLYRGWISNCNYFLIHDNQVINNIKSGMIEEMQLINIENEDNRKYLESMLE